MWRQHSNLAEYSPNTNVHPAFGSRFKVERNRKLTSSIMRLNYGIWHIGQGEKPIETTNDPNRRPPALVIERGREEMSIAGRMRGNIRPAAPGLVTWKNPYWVSQRPPVRQPIGPFTQGSLTQQSILYRLSTSFAKLGGNNG